MKIFASGKPALVGELSSLGFLRRFKPVESREKAGPEDNFRRQTRARVATLINCRTRMTEILDRAKNSNKLYLKGRKPPTSIWMNDDRYLGSNMLKLKLEQNLSFHTCLCLAFVKRIFEIRMRTVF